MFVRFLKKILGLHDYVSQLHQFLLHYDKTHTALSRSQQQEIAKYARIDDMRDVSLPKSTTSTKSQLWDAF